MQYIIVGYQTISIGVALFILRLNTPGTAPTMANTKQYQEKISGFQNGAFTEDVRQGQIAFLRITIEIRFVQVFLAPPPG